MGKTRMTFLMTALLFVFVPGNSQGQQILLAPVDPLAYAVASANWGNMGGGQLESLRKVVMGQVRAHEANSARTDPATGIVQRVKCFDPANCVMCSPEVLEYGRRMRDQLSASSGAAQGNAANLSALATYYEQQAEAERERERLNAAANNFMVIERTVVDGQEVVTTKTVTFEGTNGGPSRAQRLANEMRQQSYSQQGQNQAMMVYGYIRAASDTLQRPRPAILLNLGSDPLDDAREARQAIGQTGS